MFALVLALIAFAAVVYLFIRFIVQRDFGTKEPITALFAAMGFGFLALGIAGTLNYFLIPNEIFETMENPELPKPALGTLVYAAFMVGLIEESAKALPLALFIYKKKYFNELTDGIIYFGIVGLTFGIIEDVMYTLQFGGGVGLLRILFSPYLHAAFTCTFGAYLIQKKVLGKSWLTVFAAYLAAIFIHGVFDLAAFSGEAWAILVVLAITVTMNILLFVFFRKAQRIDESRGLSATGINKFCRNCGRPNPQRFLYCSYCGKHA